MRGLNSVTLGGNLAHDSQLRATQTSAVLSFTVCVNSSQRDGDGYVDVPNFVDCVIYGARGESLARYLEKGTRKLIEMVREEWNALFPDQMI